MAGLLGWSPAIPFLGDGATQSYEAAWRCASARNALLA